jgi:hypothetical protein
MSRARRIAIDEGEAISMESVLTVLVVLILLRLLFFIPLVNIDKAHLDKAQQDTYWKQLAEWIKKEKPDAAAAAPYLHAFNLEGAMVMVTDAGKRRYIEALSPEGDITVIRQEGQRFISFIVKGHSTVVTYRYGSIQWSAAEKEWFTAGDTIDYGEKDAMTAMQKAFREWTKQVRGF